jgi:hypothetical protein
VKLLFFLLATITLLTHTDTERERHTHTGIKPVCKNVCAWRRKKPDAEWI